ncbi:hypothetical protein ACWKSP_00265 [Micromonosporaceae bacterium Da 78-11]
MQKDLADLVGADDQSDDGENKQQPEEVFRLAEPRRRPDHLAGQLVDFGIVGPAVPDRPPHGAPRLGALAPQWSDTDAASDQLDGHQGHSTKNQDSSDHHKSCTQSSHPRLSTAYPAHRVPTPSASAALVR